MLHHDGTLIRLLRDRAGEERASQIMHQLGLVRLEQLHLLPPHHPHAGDLIQLDPDLDAWIDLVLEDIPWLRDQGWRIDIADDFPWRIVEPTGELSFEVTERSGIDWFDVDLGIIVEGERISLVPALLELISTIGIDAVTDLAVSSADDDDAVPLLLKLPDGRLLNLSIAQLRPILSPLLELFADADVEAGALRLPKRSAADLALLEEASAQGGIAWTGGDALRALGRQLRDHGGIPACPVPAAFGAELRPYQAHGLAWLQFLRSAGLGGVLADDMGLGKTVQALAHLVVEQVQGRSDLPSLVICPTSLVPNWLAEATRFAPGLRCLVLHGPQRAQQFAEIGAHELVITTYPLLARDHAVLTGQAWHVVILDEAQTIKNPLATTSKLARTLQARQRLCLSGTPLENHLGELWSLFDFLLPNWLGDRQHFGRRYRGPIEKAGNTERLALLVKRISPFLLRRTKELVASELPPKTEITESVEMGAAQRGIYDGIRLAMHAKVRAAIAKRGMAGSGIVILDALLKLRQACCDPRLLKLATARTAKARSAKFERLLELLPQMLEEGRRVLLFSQFTSMLALIQSELELLGIPYVLLTGDTRDRTAPVRQFQSGAVPLFLISLKAGGVGLNLTAADTVIHYDPWWNPAVENQATDRAHRIGQDKPVFVHRLIVAGSIEEKMDVLKQRKQDLADGIFGNRADAMSSLTEADLEMLFAG
jgi:superfamily II DNA or RNA helicase